MTGLFYESNVPVATISFSCFRGPFKSSVIGFSFVTLRIKDNTSNSELLKSLARTVLSEQDVRALRLASSPFELASSQAVLQM